MGFIPASTKSTSSIQRQDQPQRGQQHDKCGIESTAVDTDMLETQYPLFISKVPLFPKDVIIIFN